MANETFPKHIALSYDKANSDASALELAYQVRPNWKTKPGPVIINRFTEGIMNTLLKITKQHPGCSEVQNDQEAVLMRAYGRGSEILIDRDVEAKTHILLADKGLAAPFFARFDNGLLYGYLPGRACTPQELLKEPVWRAVAVRLGEWHARLPLPSSKFEGTTPYEHKVGHHQEASATSAPTKLRTIWDVMRDWIDAIPSKSPELEICKIDLRKALRKSFLELYHDGFEDCSKYVLGHCDLLAANIIFAPDIPSFERDGNDLQASIKSPWNLAAKLQFIDYEYAVACPAAFDLASHFSEWPSYNCDYNMLPTRSTRRSYIEEYLQSYQSHAPTEKAKHAFTVEELCLEVDRYRGMPGLYWGVQSLVQNEISDVEFDWGSYAEVRLAEFWAWRREAEGARAQAGEAMPFRERRWAEEA